MSLEIVQSELFNNVTCDFYTNEENDLFMTREQIGKALEYTNPRKAIQVIHYRNRDRLDGFSRGIQIESSSGGTQETVIYNEKGVYEIARYSKQPKADQFYDFVYEVISSLRKGDMKQPLDQKVLVEKFKAEASLINAKTRQAKYMVDMTKNMELGQEANSLLGIKATEILTGQPISYRPRLESKRYKATDIGKMLGVSANKIGRLANEHGLKTEEYGSFVLDQSRYSHKQVSSFLYNETGMKEIKRIFMAMNLD